MTDKRKRELRPPGPGAPRDHNIPREGGPLVGHSREEPTCFVDTLLLQVPTNQRVPRDNISLGVSVEHLLGGVETPALRVHVDEGVLEDGVGGEAGPEREGVELRAFVERAEACAGCESEGEGELVGRDGGSLEHFVEQMEGLFGCLGASQGSNHGVPEEGVLGPPELDGSGVDLEDVGHA